MLFLIHDAEGAILQSNKIFDWRKRRGNARKSDHDRFLRERGDRFVMLDRPRPVPPGGMWVDHGQVKPRLPLPAVITRTTVRVGENDAAKVNATAPLPDVLCIVSLPGFGEIDRQTVTLSPKLALPISFPTPGRYRLTFEKFPYLSATYDIEVVA